MTQTGLTIIAFLGAVGCLGTCAAAAEPDSARPVRAGIIGLDTSHAPAFARIFNDPKAEGDLASVRVVAAYPGGSPDLPASLDRVQTYTQEIRRLGIEIVDSIPALLDRVDVVLLESVDGRTHLEQVRPVFAARKPVFLDKPLAGSLVDALMIAELGRRHNVPWFSSSSLRFSPGIIGMRTDQRIGQVTGCAAWSPCPLEEHHPDLFWYGIHGVETLFTIMGTGCQSVVRASSDGCDLVVGTWRDGRIGTFRGIRAGKADYGAMVFGSAGIAQAGPYAGYGPLCLEIARFFRTGKPPVSAEETIEIFAFMEAAEQSKRQGGVPVRLEDVLEGARRQARTRLAD